MTTINLKDFYYWYIQDQFIEVTEEVAEALRASVRYEAAYQRRLTRHKAQYSLDCEDGIEYSACLHEPTPQEVLELKERFIRLWNALNSLPEIQGRQTDADPETGCMEFDIEKGRFSFRLTAPYSEERREAARRYARESNAADRLK